MATSVETIHDLEVQVDELKSTNASLEASLDAQGKELVREQDANAQLTRERDYFKSYAVEISTRLHVVQESIDMVMKAAELAGYRPTPVASFKDHTAEEIDTALEELGRKFGANGAPECRKPDAPETAGVSVQ